DWEGSQSGLSRPQYKGASGGGAAMDSRGQKEDPPEQEYVERYSLFETVQQGESLPLPLEGAEGRTEQDGEESEVEQRTDNRAKKRSKEERRKGKERRPPERKHPRGGSPQRAG